MQRSFQTALAVVSFVLLAPLAHPPAEAQSPAAEAARQWRQGHETEILSELRRLLELPNPASDDGAIRRNASLLLELLDARGFATRLLETPGSPPAVYGELPAPGAERTVVLYAHYDGQPVTTERWASPPFEPTLRSASLDDGGEVVPWSRAAAPFDPETRLYARSASDDKGPIIAVLAALDALRAAGIPPSVHLKVFLEGEEEVGSPHLGDMLRRHAETLDADGWLFLDGPIHQSRRPQVVFGVRGVVGLELTVYGPMRPLHSGHYGNWAPNPAAELAEILAGMRDSEGRIRIAGFAEAIRPLTEADRRALASIPDQGDALRHALGLGRAEGAGQRLEELILQPALNVRGLASGAVGDGAKNAVPTAATASIDFRLVPDLNPETVRRLVETHLRDLGYRVTSEEPDAATRRAHPRLVRLDWGKGYPAARTPLDHPLSRAVLEVADRAAGEPVVRQPTLGGSLPLYLFVDILGAPFAVVPMVNHDNNQHAPNENLRLGNLWDGIELYAALIAELGAVWPVD